MARKDKYGQERLAQIARCKARKTKRLKLRRKENQRQRLAGVRFGLKDAVNCK